MKNWILASLLMTSLLAADESEARLAGSRPIPEKERLEHQERRAERASKIKSAPNIAKGVTIVTSTHHGALHNPILITPLGDKIVLEDGSVWAISRNDRYKTYQYDWQQGDIVKITPNRSWFSDFKFTMTNVNLSLTIEVNLLEFPTYLGVHTYWITAIDPYGHQLCLSDNSIWDLSWFDSHIYKYWKVQDTIIMGHNDSVFLSARPNILINCETNSYVESRCIN